MIGFNKLIREVAQKPSRKEFENFYLRMACGQIAGGGNKRKGQSEATECAKAYAEASAGNFIERMKRESGKTARMVALAKEVAYEWADLETVEQRSQVEAHLECKFGDADIEKIDAIARMICGED